MLNLKEVHVTSRSSGLVLIGLDYNGQVWKKFSAESWKPVDMSTSEDSEDKVDEGV